MWGLCYRFLAARRVPAGEGRGALSGRDEARGRVIPEVSYAGDQMPERLNLANSRSLATRFASVLSSLIA